MKLERAKLNLLLLMDSKPEIEVLRTLLAGHFDCPLFLETPRTEAESLQLIQSKSFDLILAEYGSSCFDAAKAFGLALSFCPETPFLFVHTPTEEISLTLICRGAADCILRGERSRLPLAVRRALKGAQKNSGQFIPADLTNKSKPAEKAPDVSQYGKGTHILREKDEEYLELLDSSAEATWIYDVKNRIIRLSREWKKRIGAENVMPENMSLYLQSLIHPEDLGVVKNVRETLHEQKPLKYQTEYRLKPKSDEYIWVSQKGNVRYSDNGDPLIIYGTIMEITEQKNTEKALQKSEEKYRLFFNNMNEGFSICDVVYDGQGIPADFRFAEVNRVFEELTGLRAEDIIGKKLLDIVPDIEETWIKTMCDTAVSGIAKKTNGHNKRTDRFFEMDIFMLEEGKIGHIIKDITEQHLADKALRESEAQALALVKELIQTKEDLTEQVNTLGKLHDISSHYLHPHVLNELYEKILAAAIELTQADKGCMQIFSDAKNSMKVIAQQGFGEQFVEIFTHLNSERLPGGLAVKNRARVIIADVAHNPYISKAELKFWSHEDIRCEQSTPMIASSGTLIGVLTTYYQNTHHFKSRELHSLDLLARQAADLIERKRIEFSLEQSEKKAMDLVEALKKADRNKNEFLNALSHELRNPLAAITAGITLLEMLDHNPDTEKTRASIKRQTDQLCSLISDLLEITRINNGKIRLKPERVDFNDLVLRTAEDNTLMFIEKGVTLLTILYDRPIYVVADPIRLVQIIGNLLNNALKFTDPGGSTTLRVFIEDNHVNLSVVDDGIGIDKAFLADLFEPFKQAETSLDRRNGGLGLGLSIVKGIAELHGGRVGVSSAGLGKGSEFTISLPCPEEFSCLAK